MPLDPSGLDPLEIIKGELRDCGLPPSDVDALIRMFVDAPNPRELYILVMRWAETLSGQQLATENPILSALFYFVEDLRAKRPVDGGLAMTIQRAIDRTTA